MTDADLWWRSRVVPAGRVVGLDVARCLALLGMMATHVLEPYDADGVAWAQQLAGGRASGLFAVLAGVSLALMTGRTTPLHGVDCWAASTGLVLRALAIAFVGLLLGALDSGLAVILTYYGLLFLVGLLFVGLSARTLALLATGWVLVVPVVSQLVRPLLPPPTLDNPTFASLGDPGQLLSELAFTGYYPVVPWTAFLLAGMALGRLDLRGVRVAALLAAGGAALAATATVVSRLLLSVPGAFDTLRSTYDPNFEPSPDRLHDLLAHGLYGTTPTDSWWWLAVVSPHTATPPDLAQTIGSAMAVIGLCLLVSRLSPPVFAVAFGAGAMTLTLYSLHVVMKTPQIWPPETPDTYPLHVAVVLVIGGCVRLAGRRGPLEAAVASLSRTATLAVRLLAEGRVPAGTGR